MTAFLLIVGGIAGAWSRFYGGRFIQARLPGSFPLATMLINVSGSFALGLLYGVVGADVSAWERQLVLLFGTGYCGAYTTFSAFAFETAQLWRAHHPFHAIANIFGQTMLGLAAAWLGLWLGGRL